MGSLDVEKSTRNYHYFIIKTMLQVLVNLILENLHQQLKRTHFIFNENIYKQKDGVALGSPLDNIR